MRKILIVVEDPKLVNILANFLLYLKLPFRVSSAETFRIVSSAGIILNAHGKINRLPVLIRNIHAKFPNLRFVYLIRPKGSKIQKIMERKKGHYFLKTQDLMRIYEVIKRLRKAGMIKIRKVS